MNPNWKDYPGKSVLNLVFGQVSAEIFELDGTTLGVILHPFSAWTVTGTLEEAKLQAEASLKNTLTTALAKLQ